MSLYLDWDVAVDNGLIADLTPDSISRRYSLEFKSEPLKYLFEDQPKAAAVMPRVGKYQTGLGSGRIMTNLRCDVESPDCWTGLFCRSDQRGIGSILDPLRHCYILKIHQNAFTLVRIFDFQDIILQTVTYVGNMRLPISVSFRWVPTHLGIEFTVHAQPGLSTQFAPTPLMKCTDPHPIPVGVSEGLCAGTSKHDDAFSYVYDSTSVYEVVIL